MCPFNQGGKILEALYNFQMSVMVYFSPVLNLDQFKASTIELGQCVYLSPLRRNQLSANALENVSRRH